MKFFAVLLAGLATGGPVASAGSPAIRASVDRASPHFGDPFTYVVEVRLSSDDEGAEAAQVIADPGPFAVLAPPQLDRSTTGDEVVLTVKQHLSCLSAACVPSGDPRAVALPQARVDVAGTVITAAPIVVRVGARVEAAAVNTAEPQFRTTTTVPPPTTRFEPDPAVTLLASAGLLLAVAGVTLAAFGVVRGAARRSRGRDLSPLARALRLLRESSTRPPRDRRRAAGLLARLLAAGGTDATLAREAQNVAWARPDPSPRDAEVLADRTQQAVGGER